MFEKKIFGQNVRELRIANQDSQTALAQHLGVTKTQISDIENGKIATTIEKLCALADYFGVSLDYLVGRSDDPARR
jgi:transcriptional regulator with XRE-family HTH domain